MAATNVEEYITAHPEWEKEIVQLRKMILSTGLRESIKWGAPVYTLNGRNLVGIGAFRNHCALWFFEGALLTENVALLENAQEGKTKAMRQIRFSKAEDLAVEKLKDYVDEAKQKCLEGKKVSLDRKKNWLFLPFYKLL